MNPVCIRFRRKSVRRCDKYTVRENLKIFRIKV